MKVLILEDEPTNLRFIDCVLRRTFETICASSGSEAIDRCAEFAGEIGLIIADVVMPGESGAAAARLVLDSNPSAAVLFVSGCPQDSLVQRNLLNPDDFRHTRIAFLQKPFTAPTLRQYVDAILNERTLSRHAV